jgi:membrane protein DedA with SNARE-associated domain
MPTEAVLQWMAHHAYGGVFCLLMFGIAGLPVPDELLMTYVGFLVHRGDLRIAPALASAFLGTICGITLSYVLGRTLGLRVLRRYGRYVHVTPELLARTHNWFERVGKWSLTFGYFVPGVRHLTAYVAGAAELEPHEFGMFAYTGGAFWVLTFVTLGYTLGEAWLRVIKKIQGAMLVFTAIASAALLIYLLARRLRPKKA